MVAETGRRSFQWRALLFFEALTLAVEKQWDSKKIIEISKRYSMEMMGKAYSDLYHYEIKEKSKRNGQMHKD